MEEEFDLREYVRLAFRWRWVIVGAGIIAGLAALVVTLLLPPSYSATALVAVARPRYDLQFDPRIETTSEAKLAYEALPQLAMSDDLLSALLTSLDPRPKDVESLHDLHSMLDAGAGADPSMMQLTVKAQSAEEAARIANTWAELFVVRANDVYGGVNEDDVLFFAAQAEEAQQALAQAEQALVEFEARDQAAILQARLSALQQELSARLAEKGRVVASIRRADTLRARLGGQPPSARVSLADEVTALLLQISLLEDATNIQPQSPDSSPSSMVVYQTGSDFVIQVQPSEGGLSPAPQTAGELAASLEALVPTLEGQIDKLDARVAELEPEILKVQEQLQQTTVERDRLTRELSVAEATLRTLTQKVAETRIAAHESNNGINLASQAAVPTKPAGQRKSVTCALAGIAGLMLGLFAAFAVEWWRQGEPDPVQGKTAGIAPSTDA